MSVLFSLLTASALLSGWAAPPLVQEAQAPLLQEYAGRPEKEEEPSNQEGLLRQIQALQLIGNHKAAIFVAQEALKEEPDSLLLVQGYISALANEGADRHALAVYRAYHSQMEDVDRNDLAEKVAWATIRAGSETESPPTRVSALVAAVVTHDVQGVHILIDGMRSENALLRAVSVQLAAHMRDGPIRSEIERVIAKDRRWEVRSEAIRAAGAMKMVHLQPELEKLIASRRSAAEEKAVAIEAIVAMCDTIDQRHLRKLAHHRRAGLRQLACNVIAHLDLKEEAGLVLPLLKDPIPHVRISALTAIGQLRPDDAVESVRPLLRDRDKGVAVTAGWLMTILEPEEGMKALSGHMQDVRPELQREAAAALARTGHYGVPLMQSTLKEHPDPWVRVNVAIGLIGQRVDADEAADQLYTLLTTEHERWMWQGQPFRTLAPSTVRHGGRMPNWPEVVNQMVRLELLGLLAVVEHPHAEEAVKQFLGEHAWGISGVASITLLEEGSEAALDLVRDLLDDSDRSVRVQAALALAIWGKDPSAATVLEEAYLQAPRDLKINILEGLGSIGSLDSVPFLLRTLDEPFLTMRILAASALIQCLNH